MSASPITLTFTEEFRGFAAGFSFTFDRPLTVLVGENGSGKSALLQQLRSKWKGHWATRLSDNQKAQTTVEGLDAYLRKFDYCAEGDHPMGKSFADMDYLLTNVGGPGAWRRSSGQLQYEQIGRIFNKLIPNAKTGESTLLVLDEPERSLSLGKAHELAHFLVLLQKRIPLTLIVATHSEPMIRLAGEVYDVRSRAWVAAEKYLADVAEEARLRAELHELMFHPVPRATPDFTRNPPA